MLAGSGASLCAQQSVALRQAYDLKYMGKHVSLPDGGVIVVWSSTRTGDSDIYAQRFASDGTLVWNEPCHAVARAGHQYVEDVLLTSAGSYLVSYRVFDDTGTQNQTWGQLISPQGQPLWTAGGAELHDSYCYLLPNQSGGAYLLWTETPAGDDICLLKGKSIDAAHNDLWFPDGQTLAVSDSLFYVQHAMPLSGGGFIANLAQYEGGTENHVNRILRFDQWGVQVGSDPLVAPQDFPASNYTLQTGLGDVFFLMHMTDTNPNVVTLQKFNAQGEPQFPQPSVLSLPSASGAPTTLYNNATLHPLQNGGLIVSWTYDTYQISYQYRLQRLDAQGQALWDASGITVTPESNNRFFTLREDPAQNISCAWVAVLPDGTRQLKAQRISNTGTALWGAGGVLLSASIGQVIAPVCCGNGGSSSFVWYIAEEDEYRLKRQTLSTDGTPHLPAGGISFESMLGGWCDSPRSVALNGRFITFWQDQRSGGIEIRFQVCDSLLNTYLQADGKPLLGPTPTASQLIYQAQRLNDTQAAILYYLYGSSNRNYYLQIVDDEGETQLWGAGEFLGQNITSPVLDCSGGDVYIAWTATVPNPTRYLLKAQRYVNGQAVWEEGGKTIDISNEGISQVKLKNRWFCWSTYINQDTRHCHTLLVDANGNSLPGWSDPPQTLLSEGAGSYTCVGMGLDGGDMVAFVKRENSGTELYAQKMSPGGLRLWGDGGVLLESTPDYLLVGDSSFGNGSSISYITETPSPMLHLIKLDSAGNPLLRTDGVPLPAGMNYYDELRMYQHQNGWYSLLFSGEPDGNGSYYGENFNLYSLQMSPTGVPDAAGIQVYCGAPLNQYYTSLAGSGNLVYLSWRDHRHCYNNQLFTGRSIYAGVMQSGGSPVDDPQIPEASIANLSCHPNPFSSGISFEFSLREPAPVKLTIYNLRGQKVATLMSEQTLVRGEHQLAWDGRDSQGRMIPAGVYLYKLHAGGCSLRGKLIRL